LEELRFRLVAAGQPSTKTPNVKYHVNKASVSLGDFLPRSRFYIETLSPQGLLPELCRQSCGMLPKLSPRVPPGKNRVNGKPAFAKRGQFVRPRDRSCGSRWGIFGLTSAAMLLGAAIHQGSGLSFSPPDSGVLSGSDRSSKFSGGHRALAGVPRLPGAEKMMGRWSAPHPSVKPTLLFCGHVENEASFQDFPTSNSSEPPRAAHRPRKKLFPAAGTPDPSTTATILIRHPPRKKGGYDAPSSSLPIIASVNYLTPLKANVVSRLSLCASFDCVLWGFISSCQ